MIVFGTTTGVVIRCFCRVWVGKPSRLKERWFLPYSCGVEFDRIEDCQNLIPKNVVRCLLPGYQDDSSMHAPSTRNRVFRAQGGDRSTRVTYVKRRDGLVPQSGLRLLEHPKRGWD